MSTSSGNPILLESWQVDAIRGFISDRNWPAGYRYVQSIVQQRIGAGGDDANSLKILDNWLGNAADINANDKSLKSEFVRGETETFSALLGRPLSDARFQDASDGLANAVLGDIVRGEAIPDAAAIISKDVASAVGDLHLPPFAWAGTLGDDMPMFLGGLGQNFQDITGQYLFPSAQDPSAYETPSDPEVYAENQIVNTTLSVIANIAGALRAAGETGSSELISALVTWANEVNKDEMLTDSTLAGIIGGSSNTPGPQLSSSDFTALFDGVADETLQWAQSLLSAPLSASAGLGIEEISGVLRQIGAQGAVGAQAPLLTQAIGLAATSQGLDLANLGEVASLINLLQTFFHTAQRPIDPLVLDLNGSGIKTVAIGAGTHFDYNGTGIAQQTAWVTPDEGILALDKNGDGNITGDELIGNAGTAATTAAASGFTSLATLDSNNDGVIDARDSAFSQLRVWIDANGDGVSESGELKTLSKLWRYLDQPRLHRRERNRRQRQPAFGHQFVYHGGWAHAHHK